MSTRTHLEKLVNHARGRLAAKERLVLLRFPSLEALTSHNHELEVVDHSRPELEEDLVPMERYDLFRARPWISFEYLTYL